MSLFDAPYTGLRFRCAFVVVDGRPACPCPHRVVHSGDVCACHSNP